MARVTSEDRAFLEAWAKTHRANGTRQDVEEELKQDAKYINKMRSRMQSRGLELPVLLSTVGRGKQVDMELLEDTWKIAADLFGQDLAQVKTKALANRKAKADAAREAKAQAETTA